MGETILIKNDFFQKDVLSLSQFDTDSLNLLFQKTDVVKAMSLEERAKLLEHKLITLLFSEPSTRTFGSFAAAVKLLGGQTLELTSPSENSFAKGETLEDTVRVLENYSDALIIRHPEVGSAKRAAEMINIPVINAGDGPGEHPTQALLDLYTIYQSAKQLDGLTGVIVGDLKNGRTVHSLLKGLSLYTGNTLYLLAPEELQLKVGEYKDSGLTLKVITDENEIPEYADFWYWTRVQKERFENKNDYEAIKNKFVLTEKLLNEKGNEKLILLHPLPRVGEVSTEVDKDPRAAYLKKQIKNGLYVRMALLALVNGQTK